MLRRKRKASDVPAAAPNVPWRLPVELDRHIPRQVSLSGGGRALVALIVLMLAGAVAAGVGFSAASESARSRRETLATSGVKTEAEVVATGRTRDKNSRRFIVYRYQAAGRTYERRATLGRKDRRAFAGGERIAVRYLPDEPGRVWVEGYEPGGVPPILAAIVPAALLLPAGLVSAAIRRQSRLLSEGRATEGRVVGVTKHGHGSSGAYKVEYEFRTLSGAPRRAKVSTSSKPPAEGSIATILYDREDARQVAIYPLSLVRVARP